MAGKATKTTIASAALLLAGATLLFSTCRQDGGSGGGGGRGSADASGLAGSWTSGCKPDAAKAGYAYQDHRTFAGEGFSTTFTSYGDAECKSVVVIQEQVGTFVVGEALEDGATELDITIDSIFITLNNADTVQAYNDASFCGGGWEVGKKRQISRADCDQDGAAGEPDMIFEIFGFAPGGALFFGKKDAGHSGRAEAQRPVALDEDRPFTPI